MTRDTAQHLLDTYCDDAPPVGALERLMKSNLTPDDLSLLRFPGYAHVQDRIDEVIYSQ